MKRLAGVAKREDLGAQTECSLAMGRVEGLLSRPPGWITEELARDIPRGAARVRQSDEQTALLETGNPFAGEGKGCCCRSTQRSDHAVSRKLFDLGHEYVL